jgi:hypothetical protein
MPETVFPLFFHLGLLTRRRHASRGSPTSFTASALGKLT